MYWLNYMKVCVAITWGNVPWCIALICKGTSRGVIDAKGTPQFLVCPLKSQIWSRVLGYSHFEKWT